MSTLAPKHVWEDAVTYQCDFCKAPVVFHRVNYGHISWGLQSNVPGSGSDYLAIWCDQCGPQHRK